MFLIFTGMLGTLLIIGFSDELSLKQFAAFLLMFIPYIIFGFGIARLNWSLSCAIKINEILKKGVTV